MNNANSNTRSRASILKRLAALAYDTLVAVAIGMLSAMIMSGIIVVLLSTHVLPMNGAAQPSDAIQASWIYTSVIQLWSAFWVLFFFLWFWQHGGQTIGMRAWRLRLFSLNQQPVTYKRLLLRVLASLLGLGLLWMLINRKQKLAFQDKVSCIEMLVLTKQENDHKNW